MLDQKEMADAANTGHPNQSLHTKIIREDALQRKRFATLAARAALAGHTLTQVATGYMLSKWSHSKHAPDLDTIEALLARMGVKP